MNEQLRVNPCESCPQKKTGEMISRLAGQYQPIETWFFGENDLGTPYSIDAIRTATKYFRLHDVPEDSFYYGEPRQDIATQATDILFVNIQVASKPRSLFPEEIQELAKFEKMREKEQAAFAALPKEIQKQYAERAKPFLDQRALQLLDMDPDFATLAPLAEILANRKEEDPLLSQARGIATYATSLQRIHFLDQGPLQAATWCTGPIDVVTMKRTLQHPYKGEPQVRQVCFNDQKDSDYITACIQNKKSDLS